MGDLKGGCTYEGRKLNSNSSTIVSERGGIGKEGDMTPTGGMKEAVPGGDMPTGRMEEAAQGEMAM
jgi:hypothetical protein